MWKKISLAALAGIVVIIVLYKKKPKRMYGALLADLETDELKQKMRDTGLYMTRKPIYFENNTRSNAIDDLLLSGYKVQINFNYKSTGVPTMFPDNKRFIKEQAEAFFSYYSRWREQIPVVICENEWDNKNYRREIIVADYLEELAIVVEIDHAHGFKVSDAGTTGNTLGRWTYSRLYGEQAKWWKQRYFVGEDNEYEELLNMVAEYAAGIREIPVDYLNFHWYNDDICWNGYPLAIFHFKTLVGKIGIETINNEWGIKINSEELFDATKKEIESAGAKIMVAYSGTGGEGKAVQLTDNMLSKLH